MRPRPTITLIGPGNLGSGMAVALQSAGYRLLEIVYRGAPARARALARRVHARAVTLANAELAADVLWLCVGDSAIASTAVQLARRTNWKGKVVLHASGALSSSLLAPLRARGAAIASLHPMMSFVRGVTPDLRGVTFALEGDARALRLARGIARDLGGRVISIAPRRKPLYHALGAFASPLLVALLAAGERVADAAGIPRDDARRALAPILQQTLRNYLAHGPAGAFSGPMVRGDIAIIRRHLHVLKAVPEARAAYIALARVSLALLPTKKKKALASLLK